MLSLLLLALLLISQAAALQRRTNTSTSWNLDQFSNFIVFGDSYTDENRLNYFASHNGSAPPPGTYLPESLSASDGDRVWARYVIQYTGSDVNSVFAPTLTLYNYAVSGAVCSNDESPRTFATINAPFPDLDGYEVPAFLADKAFVNSSTGQGYFQPALNDTNAVYAIFDGTNDVGNYAYLTDSQVPGNTLVSYVDCIFKQVDSLYAAGGRYFVLLNLFPLDLTPQYANLSAGGVTADKFWPDKPSNVTLENQRMLESVVTVNSIYQYRTPFESLVAQRYPKANFALFDVHSLMEQIYYNPSAYLNGSAPLNVTGFINQCNVQGTNCTLQPSPDSYVWFDELHPSAQVQRTIAREFVNVISGNGSYATYY